MQDIPNRIMLPNTKWIVRGMVLLVLLIFLLNSVTIVGPGERGVVTMLGKVTGSVLEEGPHFVWPFITSVKKISIRIQKDEVQAEAATKDMQYITTSVIVNWQMMSSNVADTFRNIGDERAILERILIPAVNEVVKAATAKRTAENILVERALLKTEVDEALKSRVSKFGIILTDLSFVNFDFSKEFNDAIEQKQIAEQQAKKAFYDAERAKQEAAAEVNKAEGQAKAQSLLSQTVTPKVLALEFFKKWDGQMPQYIGSANSSVMLVLDKAMKEAAGQ